MVLTMYDIFMALPKESQMMIMVHLGHATKWRGWDAMMIGSSSRGKPNTTHGHEAILAIVKVLEDAGYGIEEYT